MVYEFKFTDPGEGITEGEIVKWDVKVGDVIKEDDILGQIETDKAVVEMPSPKGGTILKIHVQAGSSVKVGETMVTIGEKGEKAAKTSAPTKATKASTAKSPKPTKSKKGQAVVGELEEAPEDAEVEEQPQSTHLVGEKQTQKVLAAPAIRKLASEKNIDLHKIKGSGAEGRILAKDLINSSPTKEPVPQQKVLVKKKYDDYGYLERVPLKGIRKVIATHMLQSVQNAPQVTSMEDIDVTKLWDIRKKEKERLEKKKGEIKLTFLPFIVKATIAALKENPILNSSIEGDDIIIKKYFNMGIATETEVGLMVPVVKIAQDKTIIQIAKEIQDLTEKARTRKIDIMDLKGGSFTITNYGSVGGTYGVPIINYPEAAILGLGRIFDRAVLDEKKEEISNIKILPVSVTFDHRILDGAQAARFLKSLKMFLEDPDHLLLKLR